MTDWTLEAQSAAVQARRISSLELVEACLARIARLDSRLRAFITLDAEGARATAKERDAELASGRWRGPLHGLPLAYKDLCFVAGLPTSCGTQTAEYFRTERECTAVARLRAAGAVTLGKLNMSELALGPFGDNAHHGHVQNPWRVGHCSGGSSSGSGAAVAAGLALGALGTDTGGSIRLPAAACGIVGFKPTYGRVSRAGGMALSWSNDHFGPMTRTVRDAAVLLQVIAGHDAEDGTSSRRPVPDYLDGLEGGVAGVRLGVPENYYFDGIDGAVAAAVEEAARRLAEAGARLVRLRVPDPAPVADVTGVISRAESAAIHVQILKERPHELQPVVRARLEVGLQISAYDYIQALRLRAGMARHFVGEVFADVDALLAPTIPEPAPSIDEVTRPPVGEIIAHMTRFSRLTRPFNGLGLPALSVPCGLSPQGLPLGLQIVGRPFDEATVLRVGRAWERLVGGFTGAPPT
ncbi:MAG TPA: amidase [Methylomirabilota bacterium]|nr:amidase [Methylomirabilota bacterium]